MTTQEVIVTTLSFFDFLHPHADYSNYGCGKTYEYTADDLLLCTEWHIRDKDYGLLLMIWYIPENDYSSCFAIIDLRPETRGVTYYSWFSLLQRLHSEEFQNDEFRRI